MQLAVSPRLQASFMIPASATEQVAPATCRTRGNSGTDAPQSVSGTIFLDVSSTYSDNYATSNSARSRADELPVCSCDRADDDPCTSASRPALPRWSRRRQFRRSGERGANDDNDPCRSTGEEAEDRRSTNGASDPHCSRARFHPRSLTLRSPKPRRFTG